jgi:hypothetical protein
MSNGGGTGDKGGGTAGSASTAGSRTSGASGPGESTPSASDSASDSASASVDGAVPSAYLGTWRTTIDSAGGTSTRQLTIRQGKVGDSVLTLIADGPTDSGGTYHCVFAATLGQQPSAGGPLEIGPSTVTSGEPASSCTPGEATEVTLLPDGRLKRAQAGGGESLIYTRQ